MVTYLQSKCVSRLSSIVVLLFYVALSSGCATVRDTVRDANAALMEVATLTEFVDAEEMDESVYGI